MVDDRDLSVRTLDRGSAGEIAALHAEALTDDILPALGPRFLTRYYTKALGSTAQTLIGVTDSSGLVGFCQLSLSPMSVGTVLRSDPSMVLPILKLALVDARTLINGISMVLSRPNEVLGIPEIAFIVVRSTYRGRGIGSRMVTAANRVAARNGQSSVMTKTANLAARVMYETKFGARVLATTMISRRQYWYMTWNTCASAIGDHVPP